MKQYIISILITFLMVTTGVYQVQHVQSQSQSQIETTETQNKNMLQSVTNEDVTMCNTTPELEVINPDIKKEEENNKYIIMKASAYTKSVEEGTSRGITRSGVSVSRGIVSVDPKIIPLGTKLYIEGYGYAVAADTGGAIKGNRIDLYMETKKEAFEFGRRDVKVFIIDK